MESLKSLGRVPHHALAGLLAFLILGPLAASVAAQDTTLDVIHFKAPAGWQVNDKQGQAKIFTAPDSNTQQQAMIVVLLTPAQDNLDLKAAFENAVKQMTGGGKLVEPGEASAAKTRQGFDALSQSVVAEAANGQRTWARLVGANVHNRMATFCYLSNTADMFQKHQGDMDDLLGSVSFADAAPPIANANANAEYAALEREKQDLLKKVAEIEAKQRQIAPSAAAPAAAGNVAEAGAAPDEEGKAIAAAKEKFAKDVGARHKPHTILGDVLCLDGKPVPNVISCTVNVGGTTIAAERTHYGLEVDANGHFEQQVPDGLYKMSVECVVNVGGKRVPLEFLCLDGKQQGVDIASAGGIVKDYRLVMQSLKPDISPDDRNAYFGGIFTVSDPTYTPTTGNISNRHPNAKVRVTFTPQGPQVDGRKRPAFALDTPVASIAYGYRFRGIPLGVYQTTIDLIEANGASRRLACSLGTTNQYGDSVQIFWDSTGQYLIQRADPTVYVRD
ncbi:MAG TPA: hypothetical protein VH370_11115 [Humisphaera sp.]|jgi:hypothetical protein|nr:hypothetical protein [Humisphaera sp.]